MNACFGLEWVANTKGQRRFTGNEFAWVNKVVFGNQPSTPQRFWGVSQRDSPVHTEQEEGEVESETNTGVQGNLVKHILRNKQARLRCSLAFVF